MVFSSSFFLLYFLPIFLTLYHLTPHKLRNWTVLLASLFFYAWGAPKFVFILVASVLIDFYVINWMHNSTNETSKKRLLILSVSINVGLLLYFKYANFFGENFNNLLMSFGIEEVKWTSVLLPIGISFYTFQTLTYSIDVYRRVHVPFKTPTQYLVYIMLFPQMIAGPIVRFNKIADQIIDRKSRETIDNKLLGFFRFVIGLSKKVLIANVLGIQADTVFAMPEDELSSSMAWVGLLAYTFQIYYDFSGYSDMAIGLGRIMGFKFPENFNNPYVSQSITEFWKRWHITLGAWMKDYLYIPLGGNRVKSNGRLYFNLWLVFLISGLWHGASWIFVLWGAYHGLFLILDRLFLLQLYKRIGKYPSVLITFFITMVGWALFRSESIEQAFFFIKKLFWLTPTSPLNNYDNEFLTMLVVAIFFAFITLFRFGIKWEELLFYAKSYSLKGYFLMTVLSIILLIISVAVITSSGFNPFIYFRF